MWWQLAVDWYLICSLICRCFDLLIVFCWKVCLLVLQLLGVWFYGWFWLVWLFGYILFYDVYLCCLFGGLCGDWCNVLLFSLCWVGCLFLVGLWYLLCSFSLYFSVWVACCVIVAAGLLFGFSCWLLTIWLGIVCLFVLLAFEVGGLLSSVLWTCNWLFMRFGIVLVVVDWLLWVSCWFWGWYKIVLLDGQPFFL